MGASIKVRNLTIDIPISNTSKSFRTSIINTLTNNKVSQDQKSKKIFVRAIDNISFDVYEGDRVALIGHNGAGKSTLLRTLAGIYKTPPNVYTHTGKITPLFSTSIGLDLDDTGLENISTISMYLGMSKRETLLKTEEIIEFSELGDFIHLPMRTYSSGMQARLTFSIATSLSTDILLMDEAIGAGDASFADKAQKRLCDFYSRVKIMVIASHSDGLLKKLCNKGILLEDGVIRASGPIDSVLNCYHERRATRIA